MRPKDGLDMKCNKMQGKYLRIFMGNSPINVYRLETTVYNI